MTFLSFITNSEGTALLKRKKIKLPSCSQILNKYCLVIRKTPAMFGPRNPTAVVIHNPEFKQI